MDTVLDMRQVALHPEVAGHDPEHCPTCHRHRSRTLMLRCTGECGAFTPHVATGTATAECLRCGSPAWIA